MPADLLTSFERMAQSGTAPEDGCSRFGVGYEDAFTRLRKRYLEDRFERGGSSEKFVVGPFGSGKTHFLRQLMELGRELDCATSEVMLNKSVDFTKNLDVYRLVAAAVRAPGSAQRGIRSLLRLIAGRIESAGGTDMTVRRTVLEAWARGLTEADLDLPAFGRVARRAFYGLMESDEEQFEAACLWLEGRGDDKGVAKVLGEVAIARGEHNATGRKLLFSLLQFIRHAGLRGTIVGFDEAEQGLWANRNKTARMLSQLQADINALGDLRNGSALIVFAVTPDIIGRMEEYAALQQRVTDPAPGQGFFDGRNTLAAKIDLTTERDPHSDLRAIGKRLVDLYFTEIVPASAALIGEAQMRAATLADEVAATDATMSSRRTMTKVTCTMLLNDYGDGSSSAAEREFEE
jgi:hypothetical protein